MDRSSARVVGPRVDILPAMDAAQEALSDAAGLRRLGGHLALLACTASLVWASLGSAFVLPAMLLHGIVQVALFAPLHESIHRTAFRTRPDLA